jgi:hypothetical protein
VTPSLPSAAAAPARLGPTAVAVTAATVVLFVVTLGTVVLGFVTSAGALMHLPMPAIATGDALAAVGLVWLGWRIGRSAWAVERRLAAGEPETAAD